MMILSSVEMMRGLGGDAALYYDVVFDLCVKEVDKVSVDVFGCVWMCFEF
jgi:hypothetical protein